MAQNQGRCPQVKLPTPDMWDRTLDLALSWIDLEKKKESSQRPWATKDSKEGSGVKSDGHKNKIKRIIH